MLKIKKALGIGSGVVILGLFTVTSKAESAYTEKYFIQEKACWIEESAGTAMLEIRAGGWKQEESVSISEVISQYWDVDQTRLDSMVDVERMEDGLARIQIVPTETEEYLGFIVKEIPLVLKEEYRNIREEMTFSIVDKTQVGGLIWSNQDGIRECVEAGDIILIRENQESNLLTHILSDSLVFYGAEEIQLEAELMNTGSQTLHNIKSVLLYTDLNGKAEFLPSKEIEIEDTGNVCIRKSLEPGERIGLHIKLTPSNTEKETRSLLKIMVTSQEIKEGSVWEDSIWVTDTEDIENAQEKEIQEQQTEEVKEIEADLEEIPVGHENSGNTDKTEKRGENLEIIIILMAVGILIFFMTIVFSTKRKR